MEPVRLKVVTITSLSERQTKLLPLVGPVALFGWNTVPSNAKKVCFIQDSIDVVVGYERCLIKKFCC